MHGIFQAYPSNGMLTQVAKFMGPTWGPPWSCRPQMGPMLAPVFYDVRGLINPCTKCPEVRNGNHISLVMPVRNSSYLAKRNLVGIRLFWRDMLFRIPDNKLRSHALFRYHRRLFFGVRNLNSSPKQQRIGKAINKTLLIQTLTPSRKHVFLFCYS